MMLSHFQLESHLTKYFQQKWASQQSQPAKTHENAFKIYIYIEHLLLRCFVFKWWLNGQIYFYFFMFLKKRGEREVVCGQVWWPILGICPLHLTHPSAHSQQWTHTRSSGQPFCSARGAVGGSVPCSRVSPQSWYWRWREHLLFTPPTDNPCRTWESNLQPLGYKSNSLTIRPRLPPSYKASYTYQCCIYWLQIQ